MIFHRTFYFFALIALCFPAVLPTKSFAISDEAIIQPREVRPGMKGYGLTVFKGYEITRFDVHVLDVIQNWSMKQDVILVKVSGGPDNLLERSGIIAGMSGSPVYLYQGNTPKLAGALAYTWTMTKEAIGGVMPIKDMATLWERKSKTTSQAGWHSDENRFSVLRAADIQARFNQPMESCWLPDGGQPVASVLHLGGFSNESLRLLRPIVSNLHMVPVSGGGDSESYDYYERPDGVKPGAAIGAAMVRGDFSAAAIGTVTHVEGNKILAFGHPLFNLGNLRAPLTHSVVHAVLPNMMLSFKIASPTETIGIWVQDRIEAAAGVTGEMEEMIPVEIDIEGVEITEKQHYSVQIIDNKLFSPLFITFSLLDSLGSSFSQRGPLWVDSTLTVDYGDTKPLVVNEIHSGDSGVTQIALRITSPVFNLVDNYFRKLDIKSVGIKIKAHETYDKLFLDAVRCTTHRPKPDEEATFELRMLKHNSGTVYKTVKIKIPETIDSDRITIEFMDDNEYVKTEKKRAPSTRVAMTFDQLIELLKTEAKENYIYACLYGGHRGLSMHGTERKFPPHSYNQVLDNLMVGGDQGTTKHEKLMEVQIPFEAPIFGSVAVSIPLSQPTKPSEK